MLVRSNGEVGVFAHGANVAVQWIDARPAAADTYDVSLELGVSGGGCGGHGRELRLDGRVNGARFFAVVAGGDAAVLPPQATLYLGAHFHPDDAMLSWVDDLVVGDPAR